MIRKHFLFAIFQVKSTLRIIPRLLLCGIIFLAVVSVIGICGNTMLSDDSGRQMDVNIAAVMPALKQDGVIGSRMTSAGFGGCTVSIVKNDNIDAFIENVGKEYKDTIGYAADFYVVEVGDGAGTI